MAALVEPPRARPRVPEPSRYPGLTDEERGLDSAPYARPTVEVRPAPTPPLELGPPPPLWVAPSEVPPADRSGGFFDAPAALETIEPDPPPAAGLFDVPGLLERLWLARALEAGRDRPPRAAPSVPAPSRASVEAPSGAETRYGLSAERRPREPEPATAGPPVPRPVGWICPQCYLTNDAGAASCRGCRRPAVRP